jgi:hypothetical protein
MNKKTNKTTITNTSNSKKKLKNKSLPKKNKIKVFSPKEKRFLKIGIVLGFLMLIAISLYIFGYLPKNRTNNDFSCLLLDDKFCALGKPVYGQNKELIGVGFKLTEGSKIYVPFENAQLDEKKISLVQIGTNFYPAAVLLDTTVKSSCETKTFLMAYGYSQLNTSQESFKMGESFTVSGNKLISKDLGDYDLILAFRAYDAKNNQWKNNNDLLKQYFLDFEK